MEHLVNISEWMNQEFQVSPQTIPCLLWVSHVQIWSILDFRFWSQMTWCQRLHHVTASVTECLCSLCEIGALCIQGPDVSWQTQATWFFGGMARMRTQGTLAPGLTRFSPQGPALQGMVMKAHDSPGLAVDPLTLGDTGPNLVVRTAHQGLRGGGRLVLSGFSCRGFQEVCSVKSRAL